MLPLFDVHDLDRRFFERHIAAWLPEQFIDCHAHLWRKSNNARGQADTPRRTVSWPGRVADENPAEHLLATYQLMFPGYKVTPLVFANVVAREQLADANKYVATCARRYGFPALIYSDPNWSAAELEKRVRQGGFLGAKSYLTLAPAYLSVAEIRIFDFFPPHQLEVMNRLRGIVMLHIPRPGRLRDPVNLAQILEIDERYPQLQLIVAHIGRAYCKEDLGDALGVLAQTRHMNFDISANCNHFVFQKALEAVGPRRILFGSDLPILRMRARRVCEQGVYVNLVPAGLYGDVSGDRNMREVHGAQAEKITFFMYEELAAFGRAARAVGLNASDIKAILHGNARRIFKRSLPNKQLPA